MMNFIFDMHINIEVFLNFKNFIAPFFMDGVQLPQGYSHFEEAVYFLPFPEIPGTHFIDLGRMKG